MNYYNIPFFLDALKHTLEIDPISDDNQSIKKTIETDYSEILPSITKLHQDIMQILNDYHSCTLEDIFEMVHDELCYTYGGKDYYSYISVGYLADYVYGRLHDVLGSSTPPIDKCVLINSTITPFGGIVVLENREGVPC